MEERKLRPISRGDSTLEGILDSGSLYVDKTEYAVSVLRGGAKYVFLSRPRRFGKTLFVDTLEQILKGNRELFSGLYVHDNWDWQSRPVIRLDMSNVFGSSHYKFLETSYHYLCSVARSCGLGEEIVRNDIPATYFSYLIDQLYRKTGQKVAVLIDEYDYPLLNGAQNEEDRARIRDDLGEFYMMLKANDSKICFAFITGIVRFTNLSIFSKLNNLEDISQEEAYAGVCGYTDEEFARYILPYVEACLGPDRSHEMPHFLDRIRSYYDGYRFSPFCQTRVYNPVSLAGFLIRDCKFLNYWIDTGAMTSVKSIVQNKRNALSRKGPYELSGTDMSNFETVDLMAPDVSFPEILAYLFQTGYLTIVGTDEIGRWLLDWPNQEVAAVVESYMLQAELRCSSTVDSSMVMAIKEALVQEDVARFVKLYDELYALTPHQANREALEGNFEGIMFTTLRMIGLDVEAEKSVSAGDSDIVVKLSQYKIQYIIELKVNDSVEAALEQAEKKYLPALRQEGWRNHVVAIKFSKRTRRVEAWSDRLA